MAGKLKYDLTGKRYGKLVVLERVYSHNKKDNDPVWRCLCDCGKVKELHGKNLRTFDTQSCGCLRQNINQSKHHAWTGHGEISGACWAKIRGGAKHRGKDRVIEFNITIEYIWELFLFQNRKCAYSGIELKFDSKSHVYDGTASLDRIDNSKGYIPGNVQWVHKVVNEMKMCRTEEEFVSWCKVITEYQENKNNFI